jgi:dTDP-4-dehydrorhamnose reductase
MKVAVIGANGQLGTDICKVYHARGHEMALFTHQHGDIADFETFRGLLGKFRPDLVINTAAMHQVEECEKNPRRAFEVNGIGVRNLALLSEDLKFVLVQVSTDYVFDGAKGSPYNERDLPLPLNVYGNTKLSGEFFVRTLAPRHFVIRVSALFGQAPCRAKGGRNFVTTMLGLAQERNEIRVVNDEFLSPTYTLDIAVQLETLTATSRFGTYHVASQGQCSWYEFAKKIFELQGSAVKITPAHPDGFKGKVPRPKYSVLENAALQALGLDLMPSWEEGLKRYLLEL